MKISIKNETDTSKLQEKLPSSVEKQQPQESSLYKDILVKQGEYLTIQEMADILREAKKVEEDRSTKNEVEEWWLYVRNNPNIPWVHFVTRLYSIYSPIIVKVCTKLLWKEFVFNERDEEVADAVQEVFFRLSKKDRRNEIEDRKIYYLITIAENVCFTMLKKKRKNLRLPVFEDNIEDDRYTPERRLFKDDSDKKIEAFKRLIQNEKNKKRRNCCHLRFIEKNINEKKYTYEQIAKIEGISIEGVRKHINKFIKENEKQIRSILGYDIEGLL
jgi:RNA polymerase sigma factor (sigma-70 family)